jgi:hypothetical protein
MMLLVKMCMYQSESCVGGYLVNESLSRVVMCISLIVVIWLIIL